MRATHWALGFLALCPCAGFAQVLPIATLSVTVTDQNGAVIPDANVEATNEVTGARFDEASDKSGEASLKLPIGRYSLQTKASGFSVRTEGPMEFSGPARKNIELAVFIVDIISPAVQDDIEERFPLEHADLTQQIPAVPLQLLTPPSRPSHRKLRFQRLQN